MEVRLTLQELAEIGNHGFPRVSCYGHRGEQVDNGRKWSKMAENGSQVKKRRHLPKMAGNGFPRVSRHGHRGSQEDHGRNGRKRRKRISTVIW